MPVKIRKLKSGKYRVSTPNAVHAKSTSLKNAKAQETILNMKEHGIVPKGGWKNKK